MFSFKTEKYEENVFISLTHQFYIENSFSEIY